ncbi:hypothetical protein GHT06_020043 [Daphnia sinensis]|uniref:Peptidase S1 domain-containing protein n=1 Tax=Daphnia sinensis TaxID=1820382 RepID=A0AAD5KKX6_9CRUS|nr:hypothetical protein GHT06_020043 [Daphnia sinensis]
MTTLNVFAAFLVAAIALLGTVNGRVYQTSDSIIFEIDRTWYGAFLAKNFPPSQSDFVPIKSFLTGGVIPNWQIPLVEPAPEVTSYNVGLPPQQGSAFYNWLHYPFVYGGANVVPAIDSKSGQPLQQQSKQSTAACGVATGPNTKNGRIFAGTESTANAWPFMVAFMQPGVSEVNCGGSLISDTKILTAAYCFEKMSMYQLSQMVVKLGMQSIGNPDENTSDDAQMTRRIARVAIHKAYNAKSSKFDIAVVTMDTPVAFSQAISPVCLPPPSSDVDIYAAKDAYIMGWGDIAPVDDATPVTTLHEALVQTITHEECKGIYTEPGQIVPHMLCAKTEVSGACPGDGGSPLVVKSDDDNLWYQAGIASWGNGCDSANSPATVYTKVTWLRGWINGNLKN